jgi:hypothetical protein
MEWSFFPARRKHLSLNKKLSDMLKEVNEDICKDLQMKYITPTIPSSNQILTYEKYYTKITL